MSKHLDAALEVLDGHDRQRSPEADHYNDVAPTMPDDATCWRCTAAPSTSDVGLCESCLTVIRDEAMPTSRFDLLYRRAFDALTVQFSELNLIIVEHVGPAFVAFGQEYEMIVLDEITEVDGAGYARGGDE